ncbi:hypothetical protein H6P81_001022 [Aristolochia fimbriata]|uniref:non-specific serine/threonine protein kinase n=1 Tax=Aristolochia fimbriata TaxID=158543 RepID=A0AAV7F780_ARIFI|nr:hypothetical protein H6P81_001022 [Aristolochia fimbriata]
MTRSGPCFFVFLLFISTFATPSDAQREGFISLDCGLPDGASYKDPKTGIVYTSDAGYIQSGESKNISSSILNSNPNLDAKFRKVRSFPAGDRNCFSLKPAEKGKKYLVRAYFMHGSYNDEAATEFDLHLGTNVWTRVSQNKSSPPWSTTIMAESSADSISVCLVNIGSGTPFVSVVETRLLGDLMYPEMLNATHSLVAFGLYDLGSGSSTGETSIRYPDDEYDRIWTPLTNPNWISINTSVTNFSQVTWIQPPTAVMRTAAVPRSSDGAISVDWEADDPRTEFLVFRHLIDFRSTSGGNESSGRPIRCCVNQGDCYVAVLQYLVPQAIGTSAPFTGYTKYSATFEKTADAPLPPLLNAVEIHTVRKLGLSETDSRDVDAMNNVGDAYGVKKNWAGDPCLPKRYSWNGLDCSYVDGQPPRVISLNLSSSGLKGTIDPSLGDLKVLQYLDLSGNDLTGTIPVFVSTLSALTYLDLSGNKLTGAVPQFLAALSNLRHLNLSNNELSGSVPQPLIEKTKTGSLELSVDSHLCSSDDCKTSKRNSSNVVPAVLASVSAVIVVVIVAGLLIIWLKLRAAKTGKRNRGFLDLENRRFTYKQLSRMTDDFQRVLGEGGFGIVYHGKMRDGTEVAVKVLSQNCQSTEFKTEAQLLMILYHRNLVRFVGYCDDGKVKALILEYMSRGNLRKLLSSDKNGDKNTASWVHRLQIALDIAQGLEYLHTGCSPPIIHRDVKPANILLNENLEAKLADFGISKVFANEKQSQISTQVKGTHGYLDPEYYASNSLNTKSDVYSFGVVLLELITGEPAVIGPSDTEKISVVEWVKRVIPGGDIAEVVDPRVQGAYKSASAWKAVEIAVSCTRPRAVERPSMRDVVFELKGCLESEIENDAAGKYENPASGIGDSVYLPKSRLLCNPSIDCEAKSEARTPLEGIMFQRIFGKPKQETNALATLDKLNETLEMLEKKEKVLLKKVAAEIEKAKEYTRAKNKRAAIQCLKRKRLYEQQVEQLGNFQLRIHDQMILLEGAKATTETVDALRTGASAMKAMQKATNIDDVDKTMDEINEQTENMKQIQEALSTPIGAAADFDEDELEAELEELEGAELEEQLLQPATTAPATVPYVPAGRQAARPAPQKTTPEEDELAALQAEMAL